jgi:hypothetical protein
VTGDGPLGSAIVLLLMMVVGERQVETGGACEMKIRGDEQVKNSKAAGSGSEPAALPRTGVQDDAKTAARSD